MNAKKEKRQRNRDNMRKFQKKRGTSRKKTVRKQLSAGARQVSIPSFIYKKENDPYPLYASSNTCRLSPVCV